MNSNLIKYITLFAILVRVTISFVPFFQFSASTILNMGTFFIIYLGLFVDKKFICNFNRLWPICSLQILCTIYSLFFESVLVGVEFYGFLQNMIWPLCGYYVIKNFSSKQIKHVLYIIGIMFAITLYTTCIGCIQFPNAARMLASSKEENKELELLYHSLNIGGFIFVYTIILIAPLIVYIYKNYNVKQKYIVVTIYLSLLYLAITTEYTTALFLLAMTAFLFLVPANYYFKSAHLAIIGMMSIFVIVFSDLFASAFVSLSGIFESDQISERVHDVSFFFSGRSVDESSDLGQRNLAFTKSLNLFFNNILFGDGVEHGGGHSYILDTLAQFGLIGLGCLIVVFKRIYKEYITPYTGTKAYVFVLALYIVNLIQCAINTTNSLFVLCFIFPLFMNVYYIGDNKQWQKK